MQTNVIMSTIIAIGVDNMENNKINIRQTTVSLSRIAVCAALLCVLSPLTVPTPFGIGFTLQVFVVMLTAMILKPLHALAAQLIYTLLGFIGLPVFSGCQSGVGIIASPTGGFIIGFIIAAFCVSLLKGKADGKYALVRYIAVSIAVGIPCIYLPGIIGFMLVTGTGFWAAFSLVAATFIPIDIAKCVLASLIALPVHKVTGD